MKTNMKRVLALLLTLIVCLASVMMVCAVEIENEGDNKIVDDWDQDGPAAPAAPTKESATADSITLVPTLGYEYRMDTPDGEDGWTQGLWQTSNVFTGLTADTTYKFYQRVAAIETSSPTVAPSDASLPAEIATNAGADILCGDVNGDKVVDAKDRTSLSRFVANWDDVEIVLANSDTNGDGNPTGRPDSKDRSILSRHIADWDGYETLPHTDN